MNVVRESGESSFVSTGLLSKFFGGLQSVQVGDLYRIQGVTMGV